MRLVIEVSPEVYEEIVLLIRRGLFSSLTNFADVAFRNQLSLEVSDAIIDAPRLHLGRPSETTSQQTPITELRGLDYSTIKTVSSDWHLDEPLWGQINRFLPVKLACRTLAMLQIRNKGKSVYLRDLQDESTQIAVAVHRLLKNSDTRKHRKGVDKLSTALPSARKVKSKARFRNQFVGYLQSDGRPRGALSDLRLAVVQGHKASTIALTAAGAEFAAIDSPVIDLDNTERTLSDAEVEFLVDHISREVPAEWKFMKETLEWIKAGNDTPVRLTKVIADRYSSWSPSVANTNRVGVLSRLFELGLANRVTGANGARYTQSTMSEVAMQ